MNRADFLKSILLGIPGISLIGRAMNGWRCENLPWKSLAEYERWEIRKSHELLAKQYREKRLAEHREAMQRGHDALIRLGHRPTGQKTMTGIRELIDP